jgi:thiopeptide-type bacteriocin biosynthesis protein
MNKRWLGVHVFYSANPNPLLTGCIAPLTERLRQEGLVSRYFFIRYWLGGPHIRWRLMLAEDASEDAVKAVIEPVLTAFLARRPALFEADNSQLKGYYRQMFEAEYGKEELIAKYGEDGEIPGYDNNTFHYIEYEPEYERYGGELGVDLAERHFEVSSDIVLKLTDETNVHVRSIVMGHAVQLMLQICYGFFGDDEAVGEFLERYREFWQSFYQQDRSRLFPIFDRKYTKMAERLQRRIDEVRENIHDHSQGTEVERKWAAHVRQMRAELGALYKEGKLDLPAEMQSEGAALAYLLTSYVHMTNNRIGVSINDESYLSYLLGRAVDDSRERLLKEASGGAW